MDDNEIRENYKPIVNDELSERFGQKGKKRREMEKNKIKEKQ